MASFADETITQVPIIQDHPEYKIGTFEWLLDFGTLSPLFAELRKLHPSPDALVVVVGCGTSALSASLRYDAGFENVLSIDNDAAAIAHMNSRHMDEPGLRFVCADACDCADVVPDEAAALVVDKSTLDCLFCSDQAS